MGVNGEVLCKHWGSLWMEGNHTDQIYTGGEGGGVELEFGGETQIIRRLVASCNHVCRCRYWRGALTDGWWIPGALGLHLFSFSRKVLGPSSSARRRRSCNVTDWSSRWTVKIKRMTNERAAYTARGANPLLQPPSLRGSLLRSCHWGAPADSDGPWLDAPPVQQVGAGADGTTQKCLKPPQIRGCAGGFHLYHPLPQKSFRGSFF